MNRGRRECIYINLVNLPTESTFSNKVLEAKPLTRFIAERSQGGNDGRSKHKLAPYADP